MTAKGAVPLDRLLADAATALRDAGLEAARLEARALAVAVLGISRESMVADPAQSVPVARSVAFDVALRRRCAREPFARIVGVREFWSLDFALSPDTLVPRPETEVLVEAVLDAVGDRQAPVSILDLGTGSGCILLSLLRELPQARGIGRDIAEGAVETARANATRLGLSARASFEAGDWLTGISARHDVIVCNPPYVSDEERADLAPEVADHDPARALFAGADGLDAMRLIVPHLPGVLARGGIVAFECGAGQAQTVTRMMARAGLKKVAVRRDLAGIERVVSARANGRNPVLDPGVRPPKKTVGKSGVPV